MANRTVRYAAIAFISSASLYASSASLAQPDTTEGDTRVEDGTLEEIDVDAGRMLGGLEIRDSNEPLEEVTVRGHRSLSVFRAQLRAAEDHMYNVFNELNSDDDFDIHCRMEIETGSNIPRRNCRPNFLKNATEQVAQDFLRGSGNPQEALGRAHYLGQRLEREMRRLAAENPELLAAMQQYVSLEEEYREAREGRGD